MTAPGVPGDASSDWSVVAAADGVTLRSRGTGRPLVVLPGMEGDGSSCLHVVLPLWQDLQRSGADGGRMGPVWPGLGRIVLVDYAAERHPTLAGLEATVGRLLREVVDEPAVVWGQSFGCLLAAGIARMLSTDRLVLVSPFTDLPTSRDVAAVLMGRTPRPLYRATAAPVGRWVFGPARRPEGAAFLAALRDADPADVSRRAGWLRGRDHRARFEGLVDERTAVWFGVRDRLVDLARQVEVFTGLDRSGVGPGLVPYAGHVALAPASVAFLQIRVAAWLTA